MKQIVVNADPETHAWVQSLARAEKRTMGNQVLALLGIVRQTEKPKRRRAQTNVNHA